MKFKKLGFETKEGLSLTNFQDGWSMEYGEGGSYTADVMYKGKKIANVIEEGFGGPIIITYAVKDHKDADKAILTFLNRTSEYYKDLDNVKDYLKDNDVTYASMINSLLKRHDYVRIVKKQFKQGYKIVYLLDEGRQYRYFSSTKDENSLLEQIKSKGYIKPTTKCFLFKADEDLTF